MFGQSKKSKIAHGAKVGVFSTWRKNDVPSAKRQPDHGTLCNSAQECLDSETKLKLTTRINVLNARVARLQEKLLEKDLHYSERCRRMVAQAEKQHRKDLEEETERHEKRLEGEVERVAAMKACNMEYAEKRHDKMIAEKNFTITELRRRLREERTLYERQVERLKGDFEEEEKKMEEACGEEVTRMRREQEEEVSRIREEHTTVVQKQNDNHQARISELEESNKEREDLLKQKHEHDKTCLHQEIRQLEEALVARDDELYRGDIFLHSESRKTDRQLEEDFLSIRKLVDGVAGLPWKRGQQVWSEETLKRAGDGHDRRMVVEKAILKDLIWGLLVKHIFGGPFRVLGEEGRVLEGEWKRCFGEDATPEDNAYSWPVATFLAERWRYLTIKLCQEALRPSKPSGFDPRTRLIRKGYMETLNSLIEELKAQLSQVIELDDELAECLSWLCKRAAAIWLDLARHRCRLVIRMLSPEAISMLEKSSQAQQGKVVKFTVSPGFGRYGNAEGGELESFTVIGDCKGFGIEIPESGPTEELFSNHLK